MYDTKSSLLNLESTKLGSLFTPLLSVGRWFKAGGLTVASWFVGGQKKVNKDKVVSADKVLGILYAHNAKHKAQVCKQEAKLEQKTNTTQFDKVKDKRRSQEFFLKAMNKAFATLDKSSDIPNPTTPRLVV